MQTPHLVKKKLQISFLGFWLDQLPDFVCDFTLRSRLSGQMVKNILRVPQSVISG
jgi:hypothetical protein